MNYRVKLFLLLSAPIVVLVVFGYINGRVEQVQKNNLANMIENGAVKPFEFQPRSKSSDCKVRGPLPDSECTPGAIFPGVGVNEICVKGYTKSVRAVSIGLKKQIYEGYGFSYPQAKNAYEADHLIPLELGGNNDIENLFPEAALPVPGFREKDLVENYLNHEVCAGHISLLAAQEQIASNWLAVYNNLTPLQIDELKKEFKNY